MPKREPSPHDSLLARIRKNAMAAIAAFKDFSDAHWKSSSRTDVGLHAQRRAGMGENFWNHRPYQPGDPVTMVDWRLMGRDPESIFVKQKELESTRVVLLWIDPRLFDGGNKDTEEKRETGLTLAAQIAAVLGSLGFALEVSAHGRKRSDLFLRPQPTPERFLAFLAERLHTTSQNTQGAIPYATPESRFFDHAFFLSDFFLPEEARHRLITRFSWACCYIQIMAKAERDFPFRGRVEFIAPPSTPNAPQRKEFSQAQSLRDTYLEARRRFESELENRCRAHAHRFLSLAEDTAREKTLRDAFEAMRNSTDRTRAPTFLTM